MKLSPGVSTDSEASFEHTHAVVDIITICMVVTLVTIDQHGKGLERHSSIGHLSL